MGNSPAKVPPPVCAWRSHADAQPAQCRAPGFGEQAIEQDVDCTIVAGPGPPPVDEDQGICRLQHRPHYRRPMDGNPVRSCVLPLSAADGRTITTLAGLAEGGRPGRLQQTFIDEQAAQCGYCTSGIILQAQALLQRNPKPSDAQVRGTARGDRRRFLRQSGGFALAQAPGEPAKARLPDSLDRNRRPDARIRVQPANRSILLMVGKVELGQGILTALAQIRADELDVNIERIRIFCGDTAVVPKEGTTAGAFSMPDSGIAGLLLPERSVYRCIGCSVLRLGLTPKILGHAMLVHELCPEGLLFGRVVRPSTYRTRLLALDTVAVERMPGTRTSLATARWRSRSRSIRAAAAFACCVRWRAPTAGISSAMMA